MKHLRTSASLALALLITLAGCAHERPQTLVGPSTKTKASSIRVGSWNLKKLGDGTNKDYTAIAGVIENNFDLMALIEVMQKHGGHPGYDDLLAKLGSGWTGQVTDTPRPATTSPNSEFYAIIWRTSVVRACSGWSALRFHNDNDGGENGTGPDNFVREPAFGCYEYGPADKPAGDFLMAAYHATFHGGASSPDIDAEVKHLGDVFDFMQAARPGEKDLMIWGDFNRVPSQIATLLPKFADKTKGDGSTLNSTGQVTKHLYDHALVCDPAATQEMQGNARVLDVLNVVASGEDFYRTVSDHLPIVVTLIATADDD